MRLDELFEDEIVDEGVNDPCIFKAIFLAGGPGSGKSTVGKKIASATGMKIVDIDKILEFMADKEGRDINDIYSDEDTMKAAFKQGHEKLTKQQDIYMDGKLGLIIDGTGKNLSRMKKAKEALEDAGYDTMMLLVNTNLDTAKARNAKRKRVVPDDYVIQLHKEVQDNIGKFQYLFQGKMLVVDNSDGMNLNFNRLYKQLQGFLNGPVRNPIARQWLNKAA